MQNKTYEKISFGNNEYLKEEKEPNEIEERMEGFKKSVNSNQVFEVKEID